MFWLLSLFIPSLRRQSSGEPFNDLAVMLKSPQSRGLLFQIVGIIFAALLIWVVFGVIIYYVLFNVWLVVGVTMILGGLVAYRGWHRRRRESWISAGHCAECGCDLRATPDRCPECGRDAAQDEPIWRRVRRELEAKLAASIDAQQPVVEPPPLPMIPLPPGVKLVAKTPDWVEGPIPLEGAENPNDETRMTNQ